MAAPLDLGTFVAGGIGPSMGGAWSSWYAISGIALVASAMLLAFLYIWGVVFRNQALSEFVKLEIFELLSTSIIVLCIFFFAALFSTMTVGSFLPDALMPKDLSPNTNIYTASQEYFKQVEKDMAGWLELNYILNVVMDAMASITPYSRPLGVGLVASPLAGFASPIKQLLYNMSVALSVSYIMNWAQLRVYEFALVAFLKYYLPIGIFLRSFTPTRRLGGSLIAISLAFMFVFPLIQLITYGMFYNKSMGPMITLRSYFSNYLGVGASGQFSTAIADFFSKNLTGSFWDLLLGPLAVISGLFKGVVLGFFLVAMTIPLAIVGIAFAIGFIAPAFNVMMLVQATKFMSKILGEEVDISQLTRMI